MRTLIIMVTLLVAPTWVAPTIPNPPIANNIEEKNEKKIKNMDLFLLDLGFQESGNRYDVVNRFGYMGKYQFGKSTLKTLKIKVTRDAFLNSPDLQEYAMQQLLLHNKRKLQKYINNFDGQIIHGILAAAHLGGQGSVKKWFRSGKITQDGNGVKITHYMQKFGGYNLDF